jgi:hypothetical protein
LGRLVLGRLVLVGLVLVGLVLVGLVLVGVVLARRLVLRPPFRLNSRISNPSSLSPAVLAAWSIATALSACFFLSASSAYCVILFIIPFPLFLHQSNL